MNVCLSARTKYVAFWERLQSVGLPILLFIYRLEFQCENEYQHGC